MQDKLIMYFKTISKQFSISRLVWRDCAGNVDQRVPYEVCLPYCQNKTIRDFKATSVKRCTRFPLFCSWSSKWSNYTHVTRPVVSRSTMSQKTLVCASYQIVVFADCSSLTFSNRKPKIYCVPNKWIYMIGDRPFCLFPCSPFDDHEYQDDIAFLIRTSPEPSLVWQTYSVQIIERACK